MMPPPNANHSTRSGARPRNINRNMKQTFLLWASLTGALGVWFLTPASHYITDLLLDYVPLESDIEMGVQAWKSMKGEYRSVRDVWGVQEIGNSLEVSLPRHEQKLAWDFGVIDGDFVNAFALPGGIVRVTNSLLSQLNLSRGEIAALLGHEMGHVVHRHSQARVLQEKLIGYLLRAATYEDNDNHQETFGEAIGELLLKSAAFVGRQKFSRKDEYEADATSWELMIASKRYSPKTMQSLLQKLWDLNGGSGETSWESTHPGTKDRIKALQEKWDNLPMSQRNRLSALKR